MTTAARRRAALAGALGLILLAAAAPPTPPAPPRPAADDSDPLALRRWYEHGRCLVKREGALAEKLLLAPADSRDYLRAFIAADKKAVCFDDQSALAPKLHSNATRGAIIEALLLRDFSAVGAPRGRHVARTFPDGPPPPAGQFGADPRWRAFLKLAECVVRAEPGSSFALFSTPVASPEETAAVRALVPAIGDCLPPGLEVPMRPSVLRSYLAEAAYRVSAERLAAATR
ncbi:MAG: hypothetical protein JOZ90_12145 [Alphaproteobacteria bacterium]|nr:hypothetical protein [Alphaproteobacteria bacterium]MBV9371360.1 hypothetical protein [Alphaproteobacteria bacterium]MBV9901824.1 hypothetical protein [Alphaproteobacteria bacterium]